MAGELTDAGENLALDLLAGGSQTITTPLKLALLTANGSDSAAGTEVSGGSYARQTVAFGAASGGSASNSGTVTFSGMPAATVTGWEIYDSSGTPKRLWSGALGTSRTFLAGDSASFAAGQVTLSIS